MIALLLSLTLAAPGNPRELLDTAKRQLNQHKDVEARATLDRAKGLAGDQPLVLAQIYLYLGLAFAEVADEKHTVDAFVTALKLDRTLELPPDAAPKVLAWWARAGGAPPDKLDAPVPEPVVPVAKAEPAPSPRAPAIEPAAPPRQPEVVPEATAPMKPEPVAPPAVSAASRSTSHWWLLPTAAAAVAGVAGLVLVSQAESHYQTLLSAQHLGLADSATLRDQGKSYQTSGWSLVGVALAAIVAAVLVSVLIDH